MKTSKQWGAFLCLLILLTVVPQIAAAGDAPSNKELLDAAGFDLKRPLKADSITVTATRKQGAAAKLVVKQKFSMQVSFTEDTYKKSGKIGNATVLSVVTKKGTTTTLYGIAESTRDGKNWQPNFKFETKFDYAAWGSPKSAFPGRTVVSGSKEEKDYTAQTKAEAARIEARVKAETEKNKAMEAERVALKEKKEKEKALNWEKDFAALTKRLDQGSHAQRVNEIKKAMKTADKKLHKRLLAYLSKHDDPDLRSIALRIKINKTNKLEGLVNNGNPNIAAKYNLHGGFKVSSLDIGTGNIKGSFPGYINKSMSGKIDAEKFELNTHTCHMLLKMTDDNKMRGEVACTPSYHSRKMILFMPE